MAHRVDRAGQVGMQMNVWLPDTVYKQFLAWAREEGYCRKRQDVDGVVTTPVTEGPALAEAVSRGIQTHTCELPQCGIWFFAEPEQVEKKRFCTKKHQQQVAWVRHKAQQRQEA